MDAISIENCKVSVPANPKINLEQNIVHFQLTNYGLQPDDNLIITYTKKIADFNFNAVVKESELYFNVIDIFSKSDLNIPFENFSFKNPYEPENNWKILRFIFNSILFVLHNFIYVVLLVIAIIFLIMYTNKKRGLQ
ncbi:hypothetical protein [Lutibacter sp.]|uniref:hypothetical protein n=1 Tax=Lutibacter sp. TaxID=1925666 RepID=UPI0034A033A8